MSELISKHMICPHTGEIKINGKCVKMYNDNRPLSTNAFYNGGGGSHGGGVPPVPPVPPIPIVPKHSHHRKGGLSKEQVAILVSAGVLTGASGLGYKAYKNSLTWGENSPVDATAEELERLINGDIEMVENVADALTPEQQQFMDETLGSNMQSLTDPSLQDQLDRMFDDMEQGNMDIDYDNTADETEPLLDGGDAGDIEMGDTSAGSIFDADAQAETDRLLPGTNQGAPPSAENMDGAGDAVDILEDDTADAITDAVADAAVDAPEIVAEGAIDAADIGIAGIAAGAAGLAYLSGDQETKDEIVKDAGKIQQAQDNVFDAAGNLISQSAKGTADAFVQSADAIEDAAKDTGKAISKGAKQLGKAMNPFNW